MQSNASLGSPAPIQAHTNVRPRSQFNLFPEASSPAYGATNGSTNGSTSGSPASHNLQNSPPNFSRPHTMSQPPKPMADILSQAGVSPSQPAQPLSRQSPFGTKMPAATPLNAAVKRSNTQTTQSSSTSRLTLSSERSQQEIAAIEQGLDKLENKKLGQQRYIPSAKKEEGMHATALGAKLERALGRRMGGQDAVMRVRGTTLTDEKTQIST